MKFDRSNKFDLCYYGQVKSLRLKSSVASKWASNHLWGNIYFAGEGTLLPYCTAIKQYNDIFADSMPFKTMRCIASELFIACIKLQ